MVVSTTLPTVYRISRLRRGHIEGFSSRTSCKTVIDVLSRRRSLTTNPLVQVWALGLCLRLSVALIGAGITRGASCLCTAGRARWQQRHAQSMLASSNDVVRYDVLRGRAMASPCSPPDGRSRENNQEANAEARAVLQLRTHAGVCLPRRAGQGALAGAAGPCYEVGWAGLEDARSGRKDALARSRAIVCARSQGVSSGDGVVASSASARKVCGVEVQTAAPLSEDALHVVVSLRVLQLSIRAQTASHALKMLSMRWRPSCARLSKSLGS